MVCRERNKLVGVGWEGGWELRRGRWASWAEVLSPCVVLEIVASPSGSLQERKIDADSARMSERTGRRVRFKNSFTGCHNIRVFT